ncbi:MAG TPA: DUF5684 domain-containing protein [Microthrixaceae bacterium]|jgi:hypothetical protein|nr:DUF5684 domain-containing protein [Microthrixaceae bacterium]
MLATLFQNDTTNNAAAGGAIGILLVIYLAIFVVFLVGYWKVFTKLGLPGWMGIIPFVNVYMLFKARGKHEPVVWLILSLIPCINIIAMWMLANDTAELFGKELGWKIFLFLIPGISHLVLGFGGADVDRTALAPGVGLNAV